MNRNGNGTLKKIHTGAEATGGSWSNGNTATAWQRPKASETGEENTDPEERAPRRQFQHFTLQSPVSNLVLELELSEETSLLHNETTFSKPGFQVPLTASLFFQVCTSPKARQLCPQAFSWADLVIYGGSCHSQTRSLKCSWTSLVVSHILGKTRKQAGIK